MASAGVCVGCGKPISQDRLKAMPAARHCFACAVKAHPEEEVASDDATSEHPADEATELITIPRFDDEEDGSDDEHTVQTNVSELHRDEED